MDEYNIPSLFFGFEFKFALGMAIIRPRLDESSSPPCNRAKDWGSLGVSFVLAYWRVRVFGPSGIVDRQSERLYVCIIPLSGFM